MDEHLCGVEPFDGFVQLILTSSIDDYERTLAQESASSCRTYAGASACNDNDFAFESIHGSF
jgi:hypothetical protein